MPVVLLQQYAKQPSRSKKLLIYHTFSKHRVTEKWVMAAFPGPKIGQKAVKRLHEGYFLYIS